ncbi:MAG: hypothetical protein ACLQEQ_01995 [Nitrososphaerales archaeon]
MKWPAHSLFSRGISLPKAVRAGALFVTLAGTSVFALAALLDFSNTNPLVAMLAGALPVPVSHPSLYSFAYFAANTMGLGFLVSGWTNRMAGHGSSYSLAPFCALVLAAVGVMVFRLDHGVLAALKDGVILFAAPVLVFFKLGLGCFVPAMAFQELSQVASWEVSNVPLLNNWLVLVTSSGLFVLGLIHRRLGIVVRREA